MRHLLTVVALLTATSPVVGSAAAQPGATLSAAGLPLTVQVDRIAIDSRLGARFSFTSTVLNEGNRPIAGLIAHLNVFSSDASTYLDPEDWSSQRTLFLDPLSAHGSESLTWPLQAVNSGPIIIYVAVTDVREHEVVVSAPIQLSVTKKDTIDAAGILPLAVGVPLAVSALLALVVLRRRRLVG